MSPERISACMIQANPRTSLPFASIFLLPDPYVIVMYVLNQIIHVSQVAGRTIQPLAYCDLLMSIVVLWYEAQSPRWAGYAALCVGWNLPLLVIQCRAWSHSVGIMACPLLLYRRHIGCFRMLIDVASIVIRSADIVAKFTRWVIWKWGV